MKKILLSIFSLLIIASNVQIAKAMTFADGISDSKPMALLIYADWADGASEVIGKFNSLGAKYGQSYNFVLMNIASDDTKEFNKKYHIYPNLPYVILYKDNGKISRYLQKNCVMDDACFTEKLDFFIR